MQEKFAKHYSVAIDTVPLPERTSERIEIVMDSIAPVMNQIVRDAMNVAIGSWPTPEKKQLREAKNSEVDLRKEPEIDRFKNELIKNRGEFQKQLELTKEQFPLVAMAMEIQKATIKDILSNRNASELETVEFYEAVFEENLLSEQVEVELRQRITKLKRCLGRAETYSDGLACFEGYNKR